MKHTIRIPPASLLAMTCALWLVAIPHAANAQESDDLDDQPPVRHRILLVKNRFEVAPAFEASINADYKHTLAGGLKLEYHFSDLLSVGAVGFLGGGFNTGLTKRVLETLPNTSPDGNPTPTKVEYRQHLNKIPLHGAAYVTLTPWYGKLAAFGKAFVNFDFYFSGGVAFANLKNTCAIEVCVPNQDPMMPDGDPNNDPGQNDGGRVGLYLGGGIHVFLNNFVALDLTVRDYVFSDNPSGLDANGDLKVDGDDPEFLNHLFMGIGISVFLPLKAKRSN